MDGNAGRAGTGKISSEVLVYQGSASEAAERMSGSVPLEGAF